MKTAFALLCLAALAGPAAAQEARAGDLVIKDAVVRAVPPGLSNTAGYMTIVNSGPAADRLESASCACARTVQAHLSKVMNGEAMMMSTGPVIVPAKGEVSFKPGGYHLMVMDLKAPLKEGERVDMVLKFQHAGTVTVPFVARTRIEAK